MILGQGRSLVLTTLAAAGLLVGGCANIRDQQGYIVDETLVASVQPGVDNRDSVQATLGRPTFTGQFNTNEWYYVSRQTKNLAFNSPRPARQTVLRITFDEAGNVTAVDRRGLEQVVSIDPMGDKTPTLGRDKSFFEELFGNIGAVGAGGMAGQDPNNPR
ncbi:outer membrane protein assembly factor BamE [Sphingosinicella rhizophila]|uniref:Outer membrane protein assembly factor BamE n=1 Tax=Sphingosinicella rhizophila TaxID=3050082 RepID=A0ABU3Q7W0_9SPHN|nr:outer membrane protein assembly factor BamE [Sphingosinicella sp. GR2756]MDT9599505.1 outer membrane protein assembly factor BamE [Sphingosinicella sp. GR2756]